jgi:hypothetical protein
VEICTVGSVRGENVGAATVDLNGHEAGNGGYSQGRPTAREVLLYSERFPVTQLSRNLLISPFKSGNRPREVPGTRDASKTQSGLLRSQPDFLSAASMAANFRSMCGSARCATTVEMVHAISGSLRTR